MLELVYHCRFLLYPRPQANLQMLSQEVHNLRVFLVPCACGLCHSTYLGSLGKYVNTYGLLDGLQTSEHLRPFSEQLQEALCLESHGRSLLPPPAQLAKNARSLPTHWENPWGVWYNDIFLNVISERMQTHQTQTCLAVRGMILHERGLLQPVLVHERWPPICFLPMHENSTSAPFQSQKVPHLPTLPLSAAPPTKPRWGS